MNAHTQEKLNTHFYGKRTEKNYKKRNGTFFLSEKANQRIHVKVVKTCFSSLIEHIFGRPF